MNAASDNKGLHRSRMRSGLGVFVVALLNLVLQPCAMALGNMEEHDCPRCPPSHEDEQSAHAMHGGHMAAEDSASGEMPCSIAATDCSLLDEFNYDGRTVKLELNDAPNDSPIAIGFPIDYESGRRPAEYLGWHSTRSPPPQLSVPLNVFYCVYLK
ncbi:MAG: hypothetical protein KJO82_16235 [Gammaproteobacteria bacterium]|nr:hypothetical protein [Gammaproteobacteria bacterium]